MKIIAIWAFVNATIGIWVTLLGYTDRAAGAIIILAILGLFTAMADEGRRGK